MLMVLVNGLCRSMPGPVVQLPQETQKGTKSQVVRWDGSHQPERGYSPSMRLVKQMLLSASVVFAKSPASTFLGMPFTGPKTLAPLARGAKQRLGSVALGRVLQAFGSITNADPSRIPRGSVRIRCGG